MQVMGREINLKDIGVLFVSILVIVAFGPDLWFRFNPQRPVSVQPVVAKEASVVAGVPKITVQGPKRLEVYERDQIVKKMRPPAEVASNQSNQFTSSAEIEPMPYGGTAVSFTNTTSGKSGIVLTAKPRPFFEFKNVREIGLYGGVSPKGSAGMVDSRWTFARTGFVNWDVKAVGIVAPGYDPIGLALVGAHGEF